MFAGEPLSRKDRDFAMSHMHGTRKLFLDAVAGLTPEQWNFKAGPDRWSLAECAEHIAVSETFIFGLVEKLAAAPASKPEDIEKTKDRDAAVVKMVVKNEIPTAHATHAEIGDDEVGVEHVQLLQCLLATAGGDDVQPNLREDPAETFEHGRVVVDEQDNRMRAAVEVRERAGSNRGLARNSGRSAVVKAGSEDGHGGKGMPVACHRCGIT